MSSTSGLTYGISASGFLAKTQDQIVTEIVASLRSTFGSSVNLNAESFIGQLYQIFAEREAQLWQLGEAVYLSQFPAGAEGVALDNILALNNLKRLTATASVTNPSAVTQTNGLTLYGLVLFGTPGTVISAGSLVQTATNPALVYSIDNAVTIAAANNAQQTLVYSNPPTVGTFALDLSDLAGHTMDTGDLPYSALPAQTQISNLPASAYNIMVDGTLSANIPGNDPVSLVSILNSAGANISGPAAQGSSGAYVLTHNAGYIPAIDGNPTQVGFAATNVSGSYCLIISGTPTALLTPASTPAQIQAAIVNAGFPTAKVAAVNATSYAISFGNRTIAASSIAIGADTTPPGNFVILPSPLNVNNGASAPLVIPSIQSAINTLINPALTAGAQMPYTDVGVSAQGGNALVSFGANTPLTGQPSSASQPQPVMVVARNSMQSGNTHTNLTVNMNVSGAPAQAIATATCTATGTSQALAGTLSVIGSPVTGWTGVTNQLDTIAGTDDETDSAAIARRSTRLSTNAQGPLQGIVDRVANLPGVSAVQGFENTSQASLQTLTFASVPASGSFQLVLGNVNSTAPISCVPVADPISGALTPHPTANDVQAAINAIPAYASAKVAGSPTFGFSIDFSGSLGAQSQPLIVVANNQTGVAITASFGRTPNSFEIVVTGGSNAAIAQAIYASKPGGIASYASPVASVSANVAVNSNQMTVSSSAGLVAGLCIFGPGVPTGTQVLTVAGNTLTMSNTAIATTSGATYTFSFTQTVSDADGNPTLIGFSRPTQVLFYVNVSLTTDQYRTPGNPSSGVNAQSQFQPGSIQQLQNDIVAAGNAVPVGGLVVGAGTGGLIGAFNEVPGIVGYTLGFDTVPFPTKNSNIRLLPTQQALFELGNISVSFL